MFGAQAIRLLRTGWKNATLLAEELYAMFQDDIPLTHTGGLTLKADGTDAPLNLERGDFGDGPVINFGSPGGGDGGSINMEGGKLVIKSGDIIIRTEAGDFSPGDEPAAADKGKPSASTYPGQVVSGTGTSYKVKIFTQGTGGPAATVSATAPGVAADAEVPAGTWVAVSAVNTAAGVVLYYFFPPVWL